ncbi:MAG: Uma2 family endonuclease [Timaviella obliquedivisa GSE-PSE-MK23-08B]|jgi:Uma2 family endonuclease|nr:Uma2 family endonuclease [Timaviella obliquedivisa GSE-PSE-MK23-08B]
MTIALSKRFTLEEYHQLTELGFFNENNRVELIRGEIIQMIAKGTPHSVCGTRLNREITKLIGDRATARTQEPLQLLPNSLPEPDYAIVQNREDDYLASHPAPEDVVLVIEISDSSLSYDQEIKLKLYAESGIQNYWIFNLRETILETYSDPYQNTQGGFGYRVKRILLPLDKIALPGFQDAVLNLAQVFPTELS